MRKHMIHPGMKPIQFTLVFLLMITGCRETALPDQSESAPEGSAEVEVSQELPEGVSFWGFDDGPPPSWEYTPDWDFSAGKASVNVPGNHLITFQNWQNFLLFTRFNAGPETAFGIFFRAGEDGAAQLVFEAHQVILVGEKDHQPYDHLVEKFELDPGWHELLMTAEGEIVQVFVDEELLFETDGLNPLSPGAVGFINHGQGKLEIDYVEIHDRGRETALDEEPPGEGEILAPITSSEPDIVIHQPPRADRIEIGNPDVDFLVTVRGQPGAVEPGSLVSVANLETTRVYFADAGEDGSFEVEVLAHPGASLQIKQAQYFFTAEERDEILGVNTSMEVIHEWLNATTGTIVRVPDEAPTAEEGQIPFSLSGFMDHGRYAYWFFEGVLTPYGTDPEDFRVVVDGEFYLTAPGLQDQVELQEFELFIHFELIPFFNQMGERTPNRKYLISDFLSPTGFPIFHGELSFSPIRMLITAENWKSHSGNTISSHISTELANEEQIPFHDGYYAVQLAVHPALDLELQPTDGPTMRPGIIYGTGGYFFPLMKIGQPRSPHLSWGLLTDNLHEATRGTFSREDKQRIALVSMISFQDHAFIIPRDDPRTGEAIPYRLEPFMADIAYGDRGIPNPPTIDFQFPSGYLEVKVTHPDGEIEVLEPAPFLQSQNATPSLDYGKVLDYSNGGGALQDVYSLSTMDERFQYRFSQYGHHVIEMTGEIEDITGNVYTGGGTYDVYVARPLKLYSGMLPAAPFVEGDSFSPALQIYPRFPAEVEIKLTFLPDSDPDNARITIYAGQANPFGYFYPLDVDPYRFPGGGEYRVDITTRYEDEDGTLWMGTATWGNVVENADTPLIAHGIRGIDNPDINQLWFFHKNLDVTGTYHTFYPYYSGDIYWGHNAPVPDTEAKGADSIIPGVSLEDTSGTIYDLLKTSWNTKDHALFEVPGGSIEESIRLGEVRPFTTTSNGYDLSWFPELISQVGYVYQASERPAARVHESLSEGIIPISYWRYDGTYGDQVGVEGDLPNDLKWEFGGVVFRDLPGNIHQYAAYASLWVQLYDDDPVGARITPPFQGSTGGPNGGPIMILKGEEIDLLYLPRSGFPGQVLTTGETLTFSGYVGPPLDSKLTFTVTSPSGRETIITGQANKVGYYFQPEHNMVVDEAGVWSVHVKVLHDGMTSSGPTVEPYPTGGVLGAAEGRYQVYVVEEGSRQVEIHQPAPGFLAITAVPIPPIEFTGALPDDFREGRFFYTIAMPGFILEEGSGEFSEGTFSIPYDPVRLHEDFPNLDLTAYDELRPGLADQIWITALFESEGSFIPLVITLHGEEVFHR